jgi:hypothetical protein
LALHFGLSQNTKNVNTEKEKRRGRRGRGGGGGEGSKEVIIQKTAFRLEIDFNNL